MRRVIYEDAEACGRVERAIQTVIDSRDASGARDKYIVHVDMDAPDGIAFELNAPSVDWPLAMSLDGDGRVVIPVMATKSEKPIQFVSHSTRVMNEHRIHLLKIEISPAYAFTAWKSQGQTFENRVVLCLWPEDMKSKVTAEALYVVLSRVRSSSQLKYLPHNSIATQQPWFLRWEHALRLEFDQGVAAFLQSYAPLSQTHGAFHFDVAKFTELMRKPPLSIEKDVRYKRAREMACEADRHAAPERHHGAKRGRIHL